MQLNGSSSQRAPLHWMCQRASVDHPRFCRLGQASSLRTSQAPPKRHKAMGSRRPATLSIRRSLAVQWMLPASQAMLGLQIMLKEWLLPWDRWTWLRTAVSRVGQDGQDLPRRVAHNKLHLPSNLNSQTQAFRPGQTSRDHSSHRPKMAYSGPLRLPNFSHRLNLCHRATWIVSRDSHSSLPLVNPHSASNSNSNQLSTWPSRRPRGSLSKQAQ